MADPKEAALKAMDTSVKALQKIMSFLQGLSKKLVGKLQILVNAIKALLAKLNQIQQMLPSALLSSAKKAAAFLLKAIKDIPLKIKQLLRFVKSLADAIKRGATDTLEAMVRLALTSIRTMTNWFLAKVIEMQAFLKPLERLRSAIKQAEAIIKAVVAEIGDILKSFAALVDIKPMAQNLLKRLKKVTGYIGETEKNLAKYVKAGAA